jgi:hypothetical protein
MGIARKATLAVAVALIAMALSASSASAVTVYAEPTGIPCPALSGSSGGCWFHANGEVDVWTHIFGAEQKGITCNVEMIGRLDSTGAGKVDTLSFLDHPGVDDCTRTPCNLPWNVTVTGSSGAYTLTWTVCFTPVGGGSNLSCTVTLPLSAVNHAYSSIFHVRASSGTITNCELEGQIAIEGAELEFV